MIDTKSSLFIHSSDFIFVLDEDGRVLIANPEATTRFKTSPIGRLLPDLTAGISKERMRRLIDPKTRSDVSRVILDFIVGDKSIAVSWAHHEYDAATKQHLLMCRPYISMSEVEMTRWQLSLESTSAGFWFWEIWADVMFFSERLETMLGYEPGELNPSFKTLQSLVHPEDTPKNRKEIDSFLAHKQDSFKIECRCRRKDGTYMWLRAMGSRAIDTSGHEIAVGWHFDIDEQKRTEEQLRRSEERSQHLLQSIPDLLFVFDRDGKYLEVQSSDEGKLIRPAAQVLGHYLHEFFDDAFTKKWLSYIHQALETEKPVVAEYDIDVPNGRTYFEGRLFPRGDGTVMAIIRDITARRIAERDARVITERFETFLRNAPATIFAFTVSPDGRAVYTYVAGRIREMFEVSAEDITGTDVMSSVKTSVHRQRRPPGGERSFKTQRRNDAAL